MKISLSVITALLVLGSMARADDEAKLTPAEKAEVQQQLQNFTSDPKSSMDQAVPKYNAKTGQRITNNKQLRLSQQKIKELQQKGDLPKQLDPLQQQAQAKVSTQFNKQQCDKFLDKKMKKLKCQEWNKPSGRAAIEANDKVEDLTDGWIPEADLVKTLDGLPTEGKTDMPVWADDYWRIQWGITGFRYSGAKFPNYQAWKEVYETDEYRQPKAFEAVGDDLTLLAKTALKWAPSEKYDLTVGDTKFTLTKEQRGEADENVGDDGNVEEWMGICHGWAPGSIIVPAAMKSVNVKGADGLKITWYPNDIRALGSLAWANGESETNFIGGRCNSQNTKKYPNGRLSQQECFDTNPGTYVMALGNMIGIGDPKTKKKLSFVIDKTFDYEVWNQSVHSYDITYFDPTNPGKTSKDWKEVVVKYDAKFKAKDRFQTPLTRGVRSGQKYNDKKVSKVVGVIISTVYSSEVDPVWGPSPSDTLLLRMVSTGDLELDKEGKIIGGEWYNNSHPDFLWVPTKGSIASLSYDKAVRNYSGTLTPGLKKAAPAASRQGYPLCSVLAHLVNKSKTEGEAYECE